ncbi:unnamed protein product [Prorocentrum cordatum]|uniref:NADAR domain-containing protein n=1 Tax=Prorocentrum cordatum TaxID=2364126 RepID=A0ABN9RJM1_9DINO|nr:unnamed protein product [Polarella glacialis]
MFRSVEATAAAGERARPLTPQSAPQLPRALGGCSSSPPPCTVSGCPSLTHCGRHADDNKKGHSTRCVRPGCDLPSCDGQPGQFCSIRCESNGRSTILMTDPRCISGGDVREHVPLIAFYYPGRPLAWDSICDSSFLGNFYPGSITLAPPTFSTHRKYQFGNAEAAFQALKHWKRAAEFETATAEEAFRLKRRYQSEADLTYSGYGSNWNAMLAVLKIKFARGSRLADDLRNTNDAFLLEHNPVSGRDNIWSDNSDGSGTNWLGLQLMLVRDDLRSGHVQDKSERSWSVWIGDSVGIETGKQRDGRWQAAVRRAVECLEDAMRSTKAA